MKQRYGTVFCLLLCLLIGLLAVPAAAAGGLETPPPDEVEEIVELVGEWNDLVEGHGLEALYMPLEGFRVVDDEDIEGLYEYVFLENVVLNLVHRADRMHVFISNDGYDFEEKEEVLLVGTWSVLIEITIPDELDRDQPQNSLQVLEHLGVGRIRQPHTASLSLNGVRYEINSDGRLVYFRCTY